MKSLRFGFCLSLVIFLSCLFAISSTAFAGHPVSIDDKISTVTPDDLEKMLEEQKGKVVLVNTMSKIECDDHSIAGSLCIPLEIMPERVKSLPKDKLIVFYCETGKRCRKATQIAAAAGLKNIAALAGGTVGWRRLGFSEVSRERVSRQIIKSVSAITLNDWCQKRLNIFILDIRSPKDFNAGHIKGAINLSFHILDTKYSDIPKDKKIVVVDDKGLRSFLAASYLKNKGFNDVVRLGGGMEAWQETNTVR